MSVRFILDTDHVSLLQRGYPLVIAQVARLPASQLAVTVITVDEQLQGRMAVIRRAKTQRDAAHGYDRLLETLRFYADLPVLPYDEAAAAAFDRLRQQGIRIGTQDLRIAAIALVHHVTVVTRNTRDFARVPGLPLNDWSQSANAQSEA